MPNSPLIFGPNNTASNLQNAILQNNGTLLSYNGPKNYITNGTFENNTTTGWSLFSTTLTGVIPTGSNSGAVGSGVTFAPTGPNAIAGNYSLDVSSSPTFPAGSGLISNAFTIDTEDQAKVLNFRFYYSSTYTSSNANFSGTSSNSFAVYIYDVTNSAWIQPAGVYGMTQSSGVGYCSGTFQTTSNSTQYQLAIICINSANGGAIYYDDFFVGPQIAPLGAVITDAQSYTPTFTGIGTPTNVNYYYQRIGDECWIWGTHVNGTVSAVLWSMSLPSGLSLDPNKVTISNTTSNSGMLVGEYAESSGTGSMSCLVTATGTSTTLIYAGPGLSTTSKLTPQNGSTMAGTGASASLFVKVPIAGWSSNVSTSNTTDTRVVACSVAPNGQTLSSSSTPVAVTFSTATLDTHAGFASNQYVIPVSGIYSISHALSVNNNSTSSGLGSTANIYKNGSSIVSSTTPTPAQSANYSNNLIIPLSYVGSFNACDIITEKVEAVFSGGTTTIGTNPLCINRLSGPSVVAATESVNMSYTNTSGQSISNNTQTTITSWTKAFDSHNAFNASTGIYTIPVSGKYRATLQVGIQAATSTTEVLQTFIVQAGSNTYSTKSSSSTSVGNSDTTTSLSSFTFPCVAGDTLTLQCAQITGSTQTLTTTAGTVYVSIERVGN